MRHHLVYEELIKGVLEAEGGLRVRGTELWLDPPKKKPFAFVSHAHSDHMMRKHGHVLLSTATARFYLHRHPDAEVTALGFGERLDLEGVTVELLPSGHILGSAQLYLGVRGLRVLYTGDIKLSASFTAERIAVRPCDVLIMECTYGEPRFVFPDREEVKADLMRFVRECFSRRITPVVLAYTIGKAQEVVKALGDEGIATRLEKSVFEATEIYRELGVDLINYRPFPPFVPGREVIVIPPWKRSLVRHIVRKRTVFLSGWALDPEKAGRMGADLALPLSDHADFAELLVYVQLTRAKMVYTVHGSPFFSQYLNEQGIPAKHLEPGLPAQKTLWGYI